MRPEREPWAEHDPFLDDLKRYFRDVAAFEADGESDAENNRSRLAMACYDMLEKIGEEDTQIIEGVERLLPSGILGEFTMAELTLEYKLAPLRLLNQHQPECPLTLERLTPKRIETIFDQSLAGEAVAHEGCITGDELGSVACEHGLTCPM